MRIRLISANGEGDGPAPRLRLSAGLTALFFISYWPLALNGFVNWDDDANFLENTDFRGLGPRRLAWAWKTMRLGVYQPLSWILLEVEYSLWRLRPSAYHLTSLALHLSVAVALYHLIARLLQSATGTGNARSEERLKTCALLAAAAFALHPLRVEVVAWASCQPYLPCALFFVLALTAYHATYAVRRGRRLGGLVLAFALFLVALLFKASAMSLPVALLFLDAYRYRRHDAGATSGIGCLSTGQLLEKLPFLLIAGVFAVMALRAKAVGHNIPSIAEYGIVDRLLQSGYGVAFYLWKTILPTGLGAYYPLPPGRALQSWPFFLLCGIQFLIAANLIQHFRAMPGLATSLGLYCALLAPNLGLVRVGDQLVADRYCYLASGCLAVPLAYTLHSSRLSTRAIVRGGLVVMMIFAILTARQCRTWQSSERLWRNVLSYSGRYNVVAHINLAATLMEQDRLAEAKPHLVAAIRLEPKNPLAHFNMGSVLLRERRLTRAVAHFERAREMDPGDPDCLTSLGDVYLRLRRVAEARRCYIAAERIYARRAVSDRESLKIPRLVEQLHRQIARLASSAGDDVDAGVHFREMSRWRDAASKPAGSSAGPPR
jgi:tetratricopeptide (TPR) repeat protein